MGDQWHGGKGSKPRPFSVSQEVFDNNFETIFGKKKKDTLPEYELNKSTGEVEKVYPNDIPVLEGEEMWAQEAIDEELRRQEMKKDGLEE
jgi:hypothetical protein